MRSYILNIILVLLFIAIITILINLALTYDTLGIYKDFLITFIAIFSFILLLYDKLKK